MSEHLFPLSDFRKSRKPSAGKGLKAPFVSAVVFVHGIRSDHRTFEALAKGLRDHGIGPEIRFTYFDYRYRQSIAESGKQLADEMKAAFRDDCDITVVGHSMGGLVARLALLQYGHEMSFVKRLVMLGTPNHGTLHTGKLGLLAGLTREVTGFVWARLTTKTGVKELTEIDELLDKYLTRETQLRTRGVAYITIPATCFREGAGIVKLLTSKKSRGLAMLGPAFEMISAHPGWSIGLQKPHDGIVEESSVFLGTRDQVTRRSERRATCNGKPDRGPYSHLRHDDYRYESHVTIQGAERTVTVLASILQSGDFDVWREEIYKDDEFELEPPFEPKRPGGIEPRASTSLDAPDIP